ncbi:hypothetical protein K1719_016017 [Acacia pycnantha]|nr:hypothetical protein K1719_016017 [Acacia pycnantha]
MQCRPIWSLSSKETRKDLHFLNGGQMLSLIRNMLVVPLGTGIVHQVNLEYFGRVVFNNDGLLYPRQVWLPMCMVFLGVVGFKLSGKLRNGVTKNRFGFNHYPNAEEAWCCWEIC